MTRMTTNQKAMCKNLRKAGYSRTDAKIYTQKASDFGFEVGVNYVSGVMVAATVGAARITGHVIGWTAGKAVQGIAGLVSKSRQKKFEKTMEEEFENFLEDDDEEEEAPASKAPETKVETKAEAPAPDPEAPKAEEKQPTQTEAPVKEEKVEAPEVPVEEQKEQEAQKDKKTSKKTAGNAPASKQ